jgi:hypothetical protein
LKCRGPQQTIGARGYKTYRRGEAVGFVPALDRLAVRQISNRYLSEEERIAIADLRRSGLSIRKIGHKPGGHPRRCRGNCAATAAATAPTGPSKHTAGLFNAEPAVIGAGSTKTATSVN